MKLQIISDLHTEFFTPEELNRFLFSFSPQNDVDVLILAGDIGVPAVKPNNLKATIDYFTRNYKKVLFVAGNHEFYSGNFKSINNYLKSLEHKYYSNFFFLDNETRIVNNRRFIGSTLWFPRNVNNILYTGSLNDFRFIKQNLEDFEKSGEESIKFITEWCIDDGKTNIVITHHLPSIQSTPEIFKTSKINLFFINPLAEKVIHEKQPSLWIHGHTHNSCDYMMGETRIVCNPYGYDRHEYSQNRLFNKGFIVDV